jgi:hypothetical protein
MAQFQNLPIQDIPERLSDLTAQQVEEWVRYESNFPLNKLRQRQDLIDAQMSPWGEEGRKPYADNLTQDEREKLRASRLDVLTNLQIHRKIVDAAVAMKEFDDLSWTLHVAEFLTPFQRLGISDEYDLANKHADRLDFLSEYWDGQGTLQGWTIDDSQVQFVFEHGIVSFSIEDFANNFDETVRQTRATTIFRVDEQTHTS